MQSRRDHFYVKCYCYWYNNVHWLIPSYSSSTVLSYGSTVVPKSTEDVHMHSGKSLFCKNAKNNTQQHNDHDPTVPDMVKSQGKSIKVSGNIIATISKYNNTLLTHLLLVFVDCQVIEARCGFFFLLLLWC